MRSSINEKEVKFYEMIFIRTEVEPSAKQAASVEGILPLELNVNLSWRNFRL